MAMEEKPKSSIYVCKVTPSTDPEADEAALSSDNQVTSGDSHVMSSDVKIEVNGHLTSSDNSSGAPPLSSSSSRASGVGSPTSEDGTSSSASSTSLISHDPHYASREALIEQLTSDPQSTEGPDSKEVIDQLLEHIVSLKMEIETLREENKRLNSLRSEMDNELHTLTENLFEEAYKMVDEAKGGKMSAEKRLADATGKIDAMETQMSALKNLLHVPSPQPASPHKPHRSPSVKKLMKKLKGSSSKSPKKSSSSSSPTPPQLPPPLKVIEHRSDIEGESLREGEVSPQDFTSFKEWLDNLSSSVEHAYLATVVDVDVRPCLRFRTDELSEQVLVAVRENRVTMEALTSHETRRCALSGNDNVVCTHRLQLGSAGEWHYISRWCRDRIAAVCDFYMYIGHIQKGIVKSDATKLYWHVRKLRAMMSLARLSLKLPE